MGRIGLAGHFPELEDELAGLIYGGDYRGPGRSPDRTDRDGVGTDRAGGQAAQSRAADSRALRGQVGTAGRDSY